MIGIDININIDYNCNQQDESKSKIINPLNDKSMCGVNKVKILTRQCIQTSWWDMLPEDSRPRWNYKDINYIWEKNRYKIESSRVWSVEWEKIRKSKVKNGKLKRARSRITLNYKDRLVYKLIYDRKLEVKVGPKDPRNTKAFDKLKKLKSVLPTKKAQEDSLNGCLDMLPNL